ncbi:hypothetical protein CH063_04818 [Colletotrichum higginsianum]|uniref:Uncharacterized protein n=1 Tax=Colletotrichum higginsianum (strain IMI 349063) TaxID=759273 RepID=H1UWS1_COLHI|nr:hypothetical protein CH063_04818 [Colletotrichum higginsianum]
MRPAGSSIKRVCRPSSPLLLPTLLLLQRPHSSATTTNYNFQHSAQTSNHTATMPTYIVTCKEDASAEQVQAAERLAMSTA